MITNEDVKKAQTTLEQLRLAVVNLAGNLLDCAQATEDGMEYERLMGTYNELSGTLDKLTDVKYELEDLECLLKGL